MDDPLADGHAAVLLLRRPRSLDLRLGHPVGNLPEITRPGMYMKKQYKIKIVELNCLDNLGSCDSLGVQVLLADAQPAARQDSRRRLPM